MDPSPYLRVQLAPERAAEAFRRAHLDGLFRPRDLDSAATWDPPRTWWVPVHAYTLRVSTNWSAEALSSARWTPVTGRHDDTIGPVLVWAARGAWTGRLDGRLDTLAAAARGPAPAEGVRPEEIPAASTERDARQEAARREERACAAMVPGTSHRNLKLNLVIASVERETLYVPVHELGASYGGERRVSWVCAIGDAVTVEPFVSAPAVARRAAQGLGALLVLVALLAALWTWAGHQRAASVEREEADRAARLASEARRVAQLEAGWRLSADEVSRELDALDLRDPDVRALAVRVEAVATRVDVYRDIADDAVLARVREAREAVRRRREAADGVSVVEAVIADPARCDTAREVSEAWRAVRDVARDDPERRRVAALVPRLERCRAKVERALRADFVKGGGALRSGFAADLERSLLGGGFDVRVRATGAAKDELRLTFVLWSRALIFQVTDGDSMKEGSFLSNAEAAGFRKVVFSDGYDQQWWYDLHPTDALGDTLADLGLAGPLRLP